MHFFNKKPFFLTASLLSAVAVFLRFLELGFNIEKHSGFYKNQFTFSRILFILILIVGFIAGFFLLKFIKSRGKLPVNLKFDFSAFFSEKLFFAIVTVGFAANTFYEFFRLANPLSTMIFQRGNNAFAVLTAITSALCLVFFIVLCVLSEPKKIGGSLACTVLIIWSICRILRDFTSFTTILYVSKNLIDVFYLSALTLTLFAFCRLISDDNNKKNFKVFTIFAPITIILGFVVSVPSILGFICGFETAGESDVFMHFIDLTLSIFLTRFSMHLYSEK